MEKIKTVPRDNSGKSNKSNKFRKVKTKEPKITRVSKTRLLIFEITIIVLILVLVFRVGYIQFVKGEYYKEMEYNQSTSSIVIAAKRGTIYDSNKKALAISADVDTISVNPKQIVVKTNGQKNDEKTQELKEKLANEFSKIFDINYDDTLAKLNSTNETEKIVSKVENDKVDVLKKWLKENKR